MAAANPLGRGPGKPGKESEDDYETLTLPKGSAWAVPPTFFSHAGREKRSAPSRPGERGTGEEKEDSRETLPPIDMWGYLFETALGRQALRQLLQFIDTPQTFRLHLVQKQFHRRIPGSVTRLDLDQLVPSRRSSSTVAAGLGAGGLAVPLGRPTLDWIIHACPDLECLRAPGCTWFQGERRANQCFVTPCLDSSLVTHSLTHSWAAVLFLLAWKGHSNHCGC